MKKLIVTAALAAVGLGGCAAQNGYGYGSNGLTMQNYTANSYSNGLQAQRVQIGTVLAVHAAQLHQPAGQNVGAGVGAVGGGILGSSLGAGTGKALASLAGVVVGGLAGGLVGGSASDEKGQIITVELNGGQVLAVTQDLQTRFTKGERVQVVDDGRSQRVIPL